jgi:hypothetical protein
MNRSTSGQVSLLGILRLDTAIADGVRIAVLEDHSLASSELSDRRIRFTGSCAWL